MIEHTLMPAGAFAGAMTTSWAWRIPLCRHGGPRKPPVRHRPQVLSLLLTAYLLVGCAGSLAHWLG